MGNFSKPPQDQLIYNLGKGYVGLHVEQGVPVLDRDLNLLNDLLAAKLRQLIERYVGNGVPVGSNGFAVVTTGTANDLQIAAGTCLVGGIEIELKTTTTYKAQPVPASAGALPALTTPGSTQPNPRQDTVYLDVWLDEVDGSGDPTLKNPDDIGVQTAVRQVPAFVVRVAESVTDAKPLPDPAPGHSFYAVAKLLRPLSNATITAPMITDLRNTKLRVTDMERRLTKLEKMFLPSFAAPNNQLQPKFGPPGQTVVLKGKGFAVGNAQVWFGTTPTTIVAGTLTDTQMSVLVPAGMPAGSVQIVVTTDGGTISSDDTFTVTAIPAPAFLAPGNEFQPTFGPVGQAVTLKGTNFDGPHPKVLFGTVAAVIQTAVTGQITTSVPSGVTGAVTITVTTDGGTAITVKSFTVS
jgi:hypothetical protein